MSIIEKAGKIIDENTDEIIALSVIGAYILLSFMKIDTGALKDFTLIILTYYFTAKK